MPEFQQILWGQSVEAACRKLVRLAIEEDLNGQQDWTTVALVSAEREGAANVVTRERGVVAGMPAVALILEAFAAELAAKIAVEDGNTVEAGTTLVTLSGSVRDLLIVERTLLNLLSRLMGIATLASQYVAAAKGTSAQVYDTRKTTPGWRWLEKYAAHCGGARNHRMGLYDAILIKDNHLAQRGQQVATAAEAVRDARAFLSRQVRLRELFVEVEVDTLEQLGAVLPTGPDVVLLDNMSSLVLRQAVAMRDATAPEIQLEASGGVNLQTIAEIAATGVERISVGAITHSARSLDLGLDWLHGK